MEKESAVKKVQGHTLGKLDLILCYTKSTVLIDSKRIKHNGVVKLGCSVLKLGVLYGAIFGVKEDEQETATV